MESLRQGINQRLEISRLCGLHNFFIRHGASGTKGNVGRNGVVKQHDFLSHNRHLTAYALQRHLVLRGSVKKDLSFCRHHEARNHVNDGALAGAGSTHKSDHLSGFRLQAEILKRRLQGVGILVPNVFKFDVAFNAFDVFRAGVLLKRDIDHLKKTLSSGSHTSNRAVQAGELTNRRHHEKHCRDIGHKFGQRKLTSLCLEQSHTNHDGNTADTDQLGCRGAETFDDLLTHRQAL